MKRYLPRLLRYAITLFVLFWVVVGQVSLFYFIYQLIEPQVDVLPEPTQQQVASLVAVATAGSIAVGYYWFGSITAIAARFSLWISSSGEDDTLIEGRVLRDELAWRVRYLADGRVEVDHRECPLCGKELIERYLPENVVLDPNTSFDPSETSREAASEAWHDVTGKEKTEDRGETLALTCPDCNVTEPGEKEILENKDAAESTFRDHITRMKRDNPKRSPFRSHRDVAEDETNGEPTPTEIWDAYVRRTDTDDALPIRSMSPRTERGGDR